ncbi:inorganic phosphate transporter [Metallosphaera tengchongensis]|uniref:Inorganic phosphate transporter n=1 Tax=Metallosphaera tengchongensis TaxID=1532350 RepID=A0A6N0NQP7_9CREN|nr:inorganic phosphate transporter [Metallosphaera tengchongensis]QKQ99193.1 inorganic phosphate transporter [Metallosphaera tengchongensis]
MDFLTLLLFVIGFLSSFVVGGNNSATSLGILISTNSLRRRYSYLVSSLSIFFGVAIGSISMESSIYGTVNGPSPYLDAAVLFVFVASVISFYYLNKTGIPSSLSQMIYPSLAVIVLLSKGLEFDWTKFWFTFTSWLVSPLLAILCSILLYFGLAKLATRQKKIIKEMKIYKALIISSAVFTSFVTGANAIGIIVSEGLLAEPAYVTLPLYAFSAALGIYFSSRKASIVVGFRLTRMGYLSATSALLGSDIISEVFTLLGVPISITQTVMGGILGLSFRSYGPDVKNQLKQVARGWLTSPFIAVISSLAAFGVLKSILNI